MKANTEGRSRNCREQAELSKLSRIVGIAATARTAGNSQNWQELPKQQEHLSTKESNMQGTTKHA